jgi:hypothetical protein
MAVDRGRDERWSLVAGAGEAAVGFQSMGLHAGDQLA